MPEKPVAKAGATGCLLLHGFTGSPNELVDLADFLTGQNLLISLPTLPGHGTYSADLCNYGWRDWFDAVKRAHLELQAHCSQVFVCGLSMGGTLALHLAAHRPVAGVISLAGAVRFPFWKRIAVKSLQNIITFHHKTHGEDVRDKSAKAKLGSYRKFPLSAVDQLFQLARHVREDLPEIEAPLLVMHSRRDHTVDFANASLIFDAVRSQYKYRIDLEDSYHVITVDVEREKVQQEILKFIKTCSREVKPPKPARTPAKTAAVLK